MNSILVHPKVTLLQKYSLAGESQVFYPSTQHDYLSKGSDQNLLPSPVQQPYKALQQLKLQYISTAIKSKDNTVVPVSFTLLYNNQRIFTSFKLQQT